MPTWPGGCANCWNRNCDRPEARSRRASLRKLYDELEVPLIEVLAELEYNGIRLDVPLLQQLGEEMEQAAGGDREGDLRPGRAPFNIGSLPQLRKVLFEELKLPVQGKTGITGAREHRSGDAGKAGRARSSQAQRCRARFSNIARSPSSRAPTSMPCRRWSTRRRAAFTRRSIRRWRRRAG